MEKFYITTPIYYPSSNFHIGHCYVTVIADIISRYKRQKGFDVCFLTGTDEHGEKIQKKAKENNVTPKEYVDKIVSDSKDLWRSLNISNDGFIRTTDKQHCDIVQTIFKKLYEQGDIYKSKYIGKYCTPCESFWTESQLIDGKCPDCGREVKEVEEEAYFFRLSKYQKQLEEYLDSHPDFIEPLSRKNEMVNNFLKPGLEDLCVSRTSFDWGIKVPFDDKHIIYVWLDALTNYITYLGYSLDDDSMFRKYWPADLHLVGKEIMRFHTIIWPIMLMALGLPLPKKVFGHGWLLVEGEKISKSRNNYTDPRVYVDKYGSDAIRYFLAKEVPFGSDGNFSEDALVDRINSDLANVVGNLINRTIAMSIKYFDGNVVYNNQRQFPEDVELINYIQKLPSSFDEKMDDLKINEGLDLIIELFRKCNKYIDLTEPWKLAKDSNFRDRLSNVLYILLEGIRNGGILLQPFMPLASDKIFSMINTTNKEPLFCVSNIYSLTKNDEVLFKRIDKE